jgi:hypothetical protein
MEATDRKGCFKSIEIIGQTVTNQNNKLQTNGFKY